MTKPKLLRTIVPAMAALLLLLPSVSASERIRRLGKDSLGETVKEFRIHHPKAVCGRLTSIEINSRTLIESEDMEDIHCCLNDNNSLSEVSRFPILNLDGCAVHASFWKSKLYSLSYMLDVRSVQIVLDDFEKLYGSPTRELKDPNDTTRLILVGWMERMTSLELKLSRLGGEDPAKDSKNLKGAPWLEVVSINLWNSDLGD
jgi:hypothetical protein